VTVEMTDFSSDDQGTDRKGRQIWRVRITGITTNQTSRAVRDIRIDTSIHTSNAQSEGETATIGKWVGQGSTANWATDFEYESENEPDDDDVHVAVRGWSWGDGYGQCPTHGSTG
jgi:hypothetical protein